MALVFPDKDIEEELDYGLNFADWVTSGDDLQSAGTSVVQVGTSTPGGLEDIVVDSVTVVANIVVAWLSGGTVGEKYTLKFLCVDNNNPVRTVVRRATIKVKER